MILRIAGFVALLVLVASIVFRYPFLWELGVLSVVGAVYWLLFRDS